MKRKRAGLGRIRVAFLMSDFSQQMEMMLGMAVEAALERPCLVSRLE